MLDPARSAVPSRARTVGYWVATGFAAAELLTGGAWDILRTPYVSAVLTHLGYPGYFLVLLGVWKVLGGVALLAPRFPRLKEWAYAGAFFNYTGAVASHLAVGDGAGAVAYPIIQIGLLIGSWMLRPPARGDLAPSRASATRLRVIAYWVATLLLALECVAGGVMGALRLPPFIGIIRHLGYPPYFMTILGVWYVLAGAALLAPRLPRLKEWAYAGLVFNYTGAAASHLVAADGVGAIVGPIFFIGLTAASWALRPPDRRGGERAVAADGDGPS